MDSTATPDALTQSDADIIVAEGAAAYFAACRARVPEFVDRNFTFGGTLRLHRHAIGWDVVKAPANAVLSIPQVGLKLSALVARGVGLKSLGGRLQRQNLLLETAVMRELRWRIVTDLLEQPLSDGKRSARRDGLAEAILAHPRMRELLEEVASQIGARSDDPRFRAQLEATLAEYTGTRAAASEIATALIAVATGAVGFQKATPGAFALGPLLAATWAQQAAIASFPLGAGTGGIWYGFFPAQASPLLVAGTTAGLMGVAAVASAFAGILSDPVQRRLGLHRRRLNTMIGGLESGFTAQDGAGYVAYDLYVARLMDLSDMLLAIVRTVRP